MQIYDIKNDSIVIQESWPIDITLPHNLYKKTINLLFWIKEKKLKADAITGIF